MAGGVITYTTVIPEMFVASTMMEFSTTGPSGHGDDSHDNAGIVSSHKSTVAGFQ
ncbi:MAG: hypothetical protein PWQ51_1125 [Methanolobus sp.]|jgi:hypothetical protein|nr:hypothetical protein [Methanolobus sp.]